MEQSDDDDSCAKFALVKLSSSNEALKLHEHLLAAGYSEITFMKEVPKNSFTIDNELNALVMKSNGKFNHKSRRGNKRLETTAEINGIAEESDTKLSANVIAALSSLAQECFLKEEGDAEQRPSSSGTSCHDDSPEVNTAIPSPIPFVARPRGSRMQNNDDPALYASCRLCSNKIMSSRLSNLTNHVRRHAALKQYQCRHCGYSHNEMAKVRLHMQHNHQDFESSPVDGMCKEMQQQWANLMEQCFPGHAKRFAQNNSFVAINGNDRSSDSKKSPNDKELDMIKNLTTGSSRNSSQNTVLPSETFACAKCGEFVQSAKLLTHLVQTHSEDCHSFACSECNFLANYPWKVVLHFANDHKEKPCETSVVMTPSGTNYIICVPIYFPDFANRRGYTVEDDILRADYERKCAEFHHDLTALKAVQCQLCFKLFTADQNISVLLSHARSHFGIRCFSCTKCPYKSTDFGTVSAHMERKHPDTNDRPVDCSIESNRDAWQKLACYCFPDLENSLKEALSVVKKPELKRKSAAYGTSVHKKHIHTES
uniref:C2H2-type domain-containing protein n=1 Tax=Panagrolaimus sp. JU765 TaxID=591449 RepID=A0AC34Q2C8_9BILA